MHSYTNKISRILAISILLFGSIAPNFFYSTTTDTSVSADYTEDYDLIVDKSVDGYDAEAGWIDYKITYTNDSSATLTDVYVKDLVPAGLTFGGVPLSNPLVGAPIVAIGPTPTQLIREGISLAPGQEGSMIVRFVIDADADLPNVINTASAGVANTDPESGEVCDPYTNGSESTQSSGAVIPVPGQPESPDDDYDLSVTKTLDGVSGTFQAGDIVTYNLSACYGDSADPKDNIYLEDAFPSNFTYVGVDGAPAPDQITDTQLIWRSFPVDPNTCTDFSVSFLIESLYGPTENNLIIASTDNQGFPYNDFGGEAAGGQQSNNDDNAVIDAPSFDLSIAKEIVAKNGVLCSDTPCTPYAPGDEVTYSLAYTLSGDDRSDIVVLDNLPGTYVSSSPTVVNEDANGKLEILGSNPADTFPTYTNNYALWTGLSLVDGQTDTVEVTIQLPTQAYCSSRLFENISYVTIDGYDSGGLFFPIDTAAGCYRDNPVGGPCEQPINPNVKHLSFDSAEEDITNNESNSVSISLAGDGATDCTKATEFDLEMKSKEHNDADNVVYPGQEIEYTLTYSNSGANHGWIYLEDNFDPTKVSFLGVVNTGSLLEGTESPVYDRWNAQYVQNQRDQLFPYYMEPFNNAASYLTDIPDTPFYNDGQYLDEYESVNYYCMERNPEINRLMAQAVDMYAQLYPGKYNTNNIGLGMSKNDAYIDAAVSTMYEIKNRANVNFDPTAYYNNLRQCIYDGRLALEISAGTNPTLAGSVVDAYLNDANGLFERYLGNDRQHYMQSLYFMNNSGLQSYRGGSNSTYDSYYFRYYNAPYTYTERYYLQKYHPQHYLFNETRPPGTYSRTEYRDASVINGLTSADNQFITPFYSVNVFNGDWYYSWRHDAGCDLDTTLADYKACMTSGGYFQGMNDRVYWNPDFDYTVPQWTLGASGQGYSPQTPEFQGNKNISYAELIADIAAGNYDNAGTRLQTGPDQRVRGGYFGPSVRMDDFTNPDSVSFHGLYLGDDAEGEVTLRFKVNEDIDPDTTEICNTAVVATARGRNIIGGTTTHGFNNGEYMFGCDEDSNLIVGSGSYDEFEIVTIPLGTGADDQLFCGTYTASTDTLNYRGTGTSLFSRHDENKPHSGTQTSYNSRGHSNLAYKSETVPGINNFQENCVAVAFPDKEVSITKTSAPGVTYDPGDTVTFSIEACNDTTDENGVGPATINNVYVNDQIPVGLNYVGGVSTADASVVFQSSTEIVWDVGPLAPGECQTLNPQFVISTEYNGTTAENCVDITYLEDGVEITDLIKYVVDDDGKYVLDANDELIPIIDNNDCNTINIKQTPPPPPPPPQVSPIGKKADPATSGTGHAGDVMEYVLTFANNEPNLAYFTLRDIAGPGLIYDSADTVLGVSPTVTTVGGNTIVEWKDVPLAGATVDDVRVRFQIDPTLPNYTEYSNTFEFDRYSVTDCTDGDTDPASNSDSADLPFDLALRKKLDPSVTSPIFSAGDDVPYMMEVTNQGIIGATDVVITDDLPVSTSCLTMDLAKNAGWSQVGTQVNYTVASLPAGQTIQVPLILSLGTNCQELSLTNIAEISSALNSNGDAVTDIDSTPDTNLSNDGTVEDDVIDESGKDGNDEDDHDIAQIYLQQTFDLAITKSLITEGPYHGGDLVTYEVNVINQGTLDATNVEIIDYILTGFQFDPTYGDNTAQGWTASGANAIATIPSIPVMTNTTKQITVRLLPGFEGEQLMNIVEITEDNAGEDYGVEDTDSDPDNNPDNDPEDEDDHAEEFITLGNEMDLSLDKSVDTTTSPGPYVAGSTVRFFVDVTNDTDVDAYAVDVTDYIDPAMFVFVPNNGWTDDGNGNALQTIPFLAGLDTIRLTIDLVINPSFVGSALENSAEISAFDDDTDPDNEPPTDVDSDPDTDNNNDDDDEDDEDTVDLPMDFYDLALTKILQGTGPFYPGDTIGFDIEVTNQGTLDADDIQITDYTPAGLILTGSDWTVSGTNAVYEYLTIGAGDTGVITIEYVIDPSYTGTGETNRAEISGDDASTYGEFVQDIDSDPDGDNTDTYGEDNQTNSDGGNIDTDGDGIPDNLDDDDDGDGIPDADDDDDDGDGIQDTDEPLLDEDDHDPASYTVEHIYDLALTKVLDTTNTQTPIVPGGDVTYTITVVNQGTWIANDIEITDYIPTDMSLNDTDWTLNASGHAVYNTLLGPIAAGATISVPLTMTIDSNFMGGPLENNAEISDDDSEENGMTDEDSAADSNDMNDPSGDDNGTDGDGTVDEDDHDPETINVQIYDLALTKVSNTVATDFPVYPGDDITYTMIITNQGDLTAENVTITDYTLDGLTLNDTAWTLVGGNPTILVPGPIVPGASVEVDITFSINIDFTGTSFTNVGEISDDNSEDYGTSDPDSDPDADDNNDPYGDNDQTDGDGGTQDTDGDGIPDNQDDDIDGDGIPNNEDDDDDGDGIPDTEDTGNDEDDQDPEMVMIGQIYDLSLDKSVNESETEFPLFPGDDITYTITVTNEGTLPAANIEVTDYTPTGLILNDADWILSGGNGVTTLAGPILPGASAGVDITFTIDPNFTGYSFTNNSEISDDDSEEYGTTDIDSKPDSDPDNENEDDDDDDVQVIAVDQIYDLALTKTLDESQLPVYPGDDITFTHTITNQGTLPAANIEVTDYTPAGLTLNDADWTLVGTNAEIVFAGPILPGQSATLEITYTINLDAYGNSITNVSEISDDDSELYNITDGDSDPDADNTNDNRGDDDQTDGNGGNIDTDGDGILDIYDTDDDGDGILDINDDDDDGDGIPDSEDSDNDEDDEDPATFPLSQIYDLALDKSLNTTATQLPVYPGDSVTYTYTIYNQGTVPASNIEITDTIPDGLILDDTDWTTNGSSATYTIAGPILPSQNTTIDITFIISSEFTGTSFVNIGEISDDDSSDYTDPNGDPLEDLDSNPDSDPTNDPEDQTDTDGDGIPDSLDDDIDGDGIPNDQDDDDDGDGIPDSEDDPIVDEDDHDLEELMIGQIYDLALTKALVTQGPYTLGSLVTFALTVTNQGTLPAANIELTDYTPAGLIFSDPNRSNDGTVSTITLSGPLAPGATSSVEIVYTISSVVAPITNTAEISADDSDVYGTTDVDSLPDTDPANDVYGADNQLDGDGTDDEDDSDIAIIDFAVTIQGPTGGTTGGSTGGNTGGSNGGSSSSGGGSGGSTGGGSSSSNSAGGSTIPFGPTLVEPAPEFSAEELIVVETIVDKKNTIVQVQEELFNAAPAVVLENVPEILPQTGSSK